MSTLIQLPKDVTKELEQTTTPVINILGRQFSIDEHLMFNGVLGPFAITTWYATWDLDPNKLANKRDKLTELLGFKPNYHVNYEYRNAVWGLESNEHRCVLYVSIGGTSLQVERKQYTGPELRALFKPIMDKILNWEFLNSGTEKALLIRDFMTPIDLRIARK